MKIHRVELCVSQFEETVSFYKNILQFSIISLDAQQAIIQIGDSELVLKKDLDNRGYYYHFAFNIPSNLFQEAKSWLSQRVLLLKEGGQDEVYFDDRTQAHACYFEDPAGNIVEYIARKITSPTSQNHHFSSDCVMNISEISLSTNEISAMAKKMHQLHIPVRDHEELYEKDYLNFMGEYEDGAFILLGPVGRRWLFSVKKAMLSPVVIHTNKGIVTNISYKVGGEEND